MGKRQIIPTILPAFSKNLIIVILGLLLIIAAFMLGSLWQQVQFLKQKSAPTAVQTNTGTTQFPSKTPVNIKNVSLKGEPFIGDKNAPVILAYWLDFQCPFCRRFETQTLPVLIKDYVDTGKLKIVFKDFQFLGPDSQDAGLVENAVWELYPKYYFKWHQAMYNAQDAENAGFGNLESILQLIREKIPEINADKIAAQIEKKRSEYQKELNEDKAEGSSFNITGTPGFVIGTQNIQGAQPTAVFTQIIDAELAKVGQ